MSTTRKPPKIPEGLILTKRTVAFGVDENGTVCNKDIEIHVQTGELHFVIPLPDYVKQSVNDGRPYARAESAAEAIAEYERLCDKYSRIRLLAGAAPEPMLLATAFTPASVARTLTTQHVLGSKHYLGVEYQPVFVVRSGSEVQRIFERNGQSLGEEVVISEYARSWSALIPDIREARDQIDAMVESTNLAAAILDGVFTAPDPLVALMNVQMPAPQVVKVESAPQATDPRQAVLPLVDGDPFNPLPTAAPAAATTAPAPFIDPDL